MGKTQDLEQFFEGIIDLTKLFESIENDPKIIDEAMLKMKTEHKGPLIAAATAYFEGKNVSEEFIVQKVNEYLNSVENQARRKIQPVSKKHSYFSKYKQLLVYILMGLVVCVAILALYLANKSDENSSQKSAINGSVLAQGQISVETVGLNKAAITLTVSPQSTNVVLYENSKVIGRWNRGGIITQTVVHSQGEYIYYGEVFIGNQKSVTKQVAIQYGQGGEK